MLSLPFNFLNIRWVGVGGDVGNGAVSDMDDPVSHGGQRAVVGNDKNGHTGPASGFLQQTQDGFAGLIVQRAGRFVAK